MLSSSSGIRLTSEDIKILTDRDFANLKAYIERLTPVNKQSFNTKIKSQLKLSQDLDNLMANFEKRIATINTEFRNGEDIVDMCSAIRENIYNVAKYMPEYEELPLNDKAHLENIGATLFHPKATNLSVQDYLARATAKQRAYIACGKRLNELATQVALLDKAKNNKTAPNFELTVSALNPANLLKEIRNALVVTDDQIKQQEKLLAECDQIKQLLESSGYRYEESEKYLIPFQSFFSYVEPSNVTTVATEHFAQMTAKIDRTREEQQQIQAQHPATADYELQLIALTLPTGEKSVLEKIKDELSNELAQKIQIITPLDEKEARYTSNRQAQDKLTDNEQESLTSAKIKKRSIEASLTKINQLLTVTSLKNYKKGLADPILLQALPQATRRSYSQDLDNELSKRILASITKYATDLAMQNPAHPQINAFHALFIANHTSFDPNSVAIKQAMDLLDGSKTEQTLLPAIHVHDAATEQLTQLLIQLFNLWKSSPTTIPAAIKTAFDQHATATRHPINEQLQYLIGKMQHNLALYHNHHVALSQNRILKQELAQLQQWCKQGDFASVKKFLAEKRSLQGFLQAIFELPELRCTRTEGGHFPSAAQLKEYMESTTTSPFEPVQGPLLAGLANLEELLHTNNIIPAGELEGLLRTNNIISRNEIIPALAIDNYSRAIDNYLRSSLKFLAGYMDNIRKALSQIKPYCQHASQKALFEKYEAQINRYWGTVITGFIEPLNAINHLLFDLSFLLNTPQLEKTHKSLTDSAEVIQNWITDQKNFFTGDGDNSDFENFLDPISQQLPNTEARQCTKTKTFFDLSSLSQLAGYHRSFAHPISREQVTLNDFPKHETASHAFRAVHVLEQAYKLQITATEQQLLTEKRDQWLAAELAPLLAANTDFTRLRNIDGSERSARFLTWLVDNGYWQSAKLLYQAKQFSPQEEAAAIAKLADHPLICGKKETVATPAQPTAAVRTPAANPAPIQPAPKLVAAPKIAAPKQQQQQSASSSTAGMFAMPKTVAAQPQIQRPKRHQPLANTNNNPTRSTTGEYDHLFKVCLAGDSGTGKTALMMRYADNTFTESFISTIGVDFKIRMHNVGDKTVKIQLYGTAGQERFRKIDTEYFRSAHAVIITYDCTDQTSFNNLKNWFAQVEDLGALVAIVETKNDLATAKREVDLHDAQQYATQIGAIFHSTSAKKGDNVELLFQDLVAQLVMRAEQTETNQAQPVASAPSSTAVTTSQTSTSGNFSVRGFLSAALGLNSENPDPQPAANGNTRRQL